MSTLERRFISTAQVRAIAPTQFSSSPGTLVGYAAKYLTLSSNLGGFVERIAPGCFDRALREGDDVRCLINHDPSLLVGRTKNGSLRLRSDAVGLHNTCDVADTSFGRDLVENVRTGNMTDQSFGFTCDDESWSDEPDPDDPTARINVRTLRSVRLMDTSYVTYPAYPHTSVAPNAPVRSLSFDQLFPDGVPVEIRSRVGHDVRARYELPVERRRRLVNMILSI